jgi:hypothetical protein
VDELTDREHDERRWSAGTKPAKDGTAHPVAATVL